MSNNDATKEFYPSKNSGNTIDITIVPDNYGSEITWRLKDPNGTVVASGGPYTDGQTAPITTTATGLSNGCHTFEIFDEYGDGICCQYGNGSYTLESNGAVLYTGGEYGTSDTRVMNVGGSLGIDAVEMLTQVNVYPNPMTDNATVSFNMVEDAEVIMEMVNMLGAKVMSMNLGERGAGANNITLNASGLPSGVYMLNLIVNGNIHTTRLNISK